MKILVAVFLVSVFAAASANAQPVVSPDMIEISLDGAVFVEASSYVSEIAISTGTVPAGSASIYVGRGVVMQWAAQLGTPYADQMVQWKLDTSLLPSTAQKFSLKFKFAVGSAESPYSDPSDEITLINVGKPGKPTVLIF